MKGFTQHHFVMYYVYLLQSKICNETYVGSSNDVRRRVQEHNNGLVRSTNRYKPWQLVSYEAYQSEEDARGREQKLKAHGNALREWKKRAKRSLQNSAGFTLIELLLVIAIIILVSTAVAPISNSFQTRNDTDVTRNSIVGSLRRAQGLARGVLSDQPWGVYITTGSSTIFQGTSFASRNTAVDEVTEISPTITPSGIQEVVFSKVTGFPTATGTLTITSISNDVRSISINEKGTVSF